MVLGTCEGYVEEVVAVKDGGDDNGEIELVLEIVDVLEKDVSDERKGVVYVYVVL